MAKPAQSNKSHPYRALAVFLVAAGLVGLGIFAWRVVRGIQLPEAPLANAPRAATIIGYVRVANVLQSSMVRRIIRPELVQERIARLRERCGFDPTTQLEDVIVFLEGNQIRNPVDKVGIVGRGPFEHERLVACFREAFAEEGLGETRQIEIADVPAAAPANSNQRAAFLGKRGIAIGNEETIRHVIHTVRDSHPSAAQDPQLRRLWERTAGGRDVVIVGLMPQDWQQAVREAVGMNAEVPYRGTIDQIAAFSLGADVTRGLRLGGVLAMRDTASATALATSVRAQIDQLTENVFVSLTPFGPVLRSIHTEQSGQDFVVTMDLPPERLDRMIEFAEGFMRNRESQGGAPTAPGPMAPPSQGPLGIPAPTTTVTPTP